MTCCPYYAYLPISPPCDLFEKRRKIVTTTRHVCGKTHLLVYNISLYSLIIAPYKYQRNINYTKGEQRWTYLKRDLFQPIQDSENKIYKRTTVCKRGSGVYYIC